KLTVKGVQGHAAYPHLADNPVRGLLTLAEALLLPPLDEGTGNFQPTGIEITSIDVGNPAANVIPAKAAAVFNIRFNDLWDAETLKEELSRRLTAAARDRRLRPAGKGPVDFVLEIVGRVSPVFLTRDEKL